MAKFTDFTDFTDAPEMKGRVFFGSFSPEQEPRLCIATGRKMTLDFPSGSKTFYQLHADARGYRKFKDLRRFTEIEINKKNQKAVANIVSDLYSYAKKKKRKAEVTYWTAYAKKQKLKIA